jgi:hypothetical protein
MTIIDNIPFVVGNILAKFRELGNPETVSRAAAVAVLPEFRNRIHVEGKKTDGSAIGTYSNSYLKLRQRPPYNRTSDPDVIASLTRQLENSYVLVATEKGYTIGLNDAQGKSKATAPPPNNKVVTGEQKIRHIESMFGIIWQLSQKELDQTQLVAQNTAIALMNA